MSRPREIQLSYCDSWKGYKKNNRTISLERNERTELSCEYGNAKDIERLVYNYGFNENFPPTSFYKYNYLLIELLNL